MGPRISTGQLKKQEGLQQYTYIITHIFLVAFPEPCNHCGSMRRESVKGGHDGYMISRSLTEDSRKRMSDSEVGLSGIDVSLTLGSFFWSGPKYAVDGRWVIGECVTKGLVELC
jgi:hypothetical protein